MEGRRYSRSVPGAFPVVDLTPLAHRAEGEDADHGHTKSSGGRPDHETEGSRGAAVSGALDVDERVADESAS